MILEIADLDSFGGMNAKNLKHALEGSLKKLQTNFIDILYVSSETHIDTGLS
jgi:aryl-alcohol dehydrogenase-like predicted oxidoreductase